MSENKDKLTPMFEQYKRIKQNYPDALLFFRMGDFYELFFEDAITASRELQIALTTRGKNGANAAPMCGVPWHASQSYITQLTSKGYSIAICEQIEDPKTKKGLVARAVSHVITPGTIIDENSLNNKNHNYLGAIFCGMHNICAFAWADISTGQWTGLEFKRQSDMWQWVRKLSPSELLLVDGQQLPLNFGQENIRTVYQQPVCFELKRAAERILSAQKVLEINALGLENKPELIRACGAILAYMEQTQLKSPDQLMPFKPLDIGKKLLIDELTERNLEIFTTLNGKKGKGTLRAVLDETITPMGARFMEDMLHHPWKDIKIISQIQSCVAWLHDHDDFRSRLRYLLSEILDIERLMMRICLGRASCRDIFSFKQSLSGLNCIKEFFENTENLPETFFNAVKSIDVPDDCLNFLEYRLVENIQDADGDLGIFKPGWHTELDIQLDLLKNGNEKIENLLNEEKEKTGLSKLKIGYNRVFGFYFEISKAAGVKEIPDYFERKQSLVSTERFTTEKLRNLENDILMASEKRKQLESELFDNLISYLAAQKERILHTADIIAQIDYWQSLAETGRKESWIMPKLDESSNLHIKCGRHPVIESIIGKTNFVPNDFHMDNARKLCLITGPNMAGKSTVLRQVALICLLAQMGSMVPAAKAELGIVDRLFSRVGASDNLAQGQSTFMVEMMETARILRQAGKKSLVILDELGRGTSTYDGMSIAWAVVEDLAAKAGGQIRTIFATHYHELTALEGIIPGLFTMNIAAGEYAANEILFLHKLLYGPSDKSYGIEVARLAGIPNNVVQRARDILKSLEQKKSGQTIRTLVLPGMKKLNENEIIKELCSLNLAELTIEEALAYMQKWQQSVCNNGN